MVEGQIEIAVLGPLEIRGAAQPFTRGAARELVVYLALHRHEVRNEAWVDALWTGRPIAAATVYSTASVARRALGRSFDGLDHLPRQRGSLRLGDSVVTDIEVFARSASGTDPAGWIEALELVRGRPFEGLCRSDWAVLDGTQAEVESMVVTTALRAAQHELEVHEGGQAERLLRLALRASPYDERLHRALLRALEAQGNRMKVRSAMADLVSLATVPAGARLGEAGPDAAARMHPATVALYCELAHVEVPVARGDPARL
jgi:DNA-binding SARP family transcriptional activator